MALPYPAKSRTWDLGTAANGLFFDTEFDQLYANDDYLLSRSLDGINSLTSKPTPVGADVIAIGDSAASFAGKKAALNTLAGAIMAYAKLSDTKAANTPGGTFTSGAWRTRDLNTKDTDDAGIVTLSDNQFTLQAGTYRTSASVPAYSVALAQAKLWNATDGTDVIIGGGGYYPPGGPSDMARIPVVGQFTIAAQKTFEIQQYCSVTHVTNGFGVQQNFGVSEVYTIVELWKVA